MATAADIALDPEIRKCWELDQTMRASGLTDPLAAEREGGERSGAFWCEGGPEMHGRTKSNGHGRKMPELEDEEDEES